MSADETSSTRPAGSPDAAFGEIPVSTTAKTLSPAAQRALAEAEERRRLAAQQNSDAPTEIAGRGGLDPVRYGDWEIKGLTSDF